MSAATPGQAERERFAAKMEMLAEWFDADDFAKGRAGRTEVQEDLRRWAAAARDLIAQEPHAADGIPLRSDAETAAMLRADLADAEAQLARWPKCPAGCSCRIGIKDDPDRNECGCDGPCNGGEQPAPGSAAVLAKVRRALEDSPTASIARREALEIINATREGKP